MNYHDRLFYIMRNFVEYGQYGKDPKKALKVFRKYFPEEEEEKCKTDFENFRSAFEDAITLMRSHTAYFTQKHANSSLPTSDEENVFRQQHKDVPENFLNAIIGWVYHWHIER